jgi:hypothetical protein
LADKSNHEAFISTVKTTNKATNYAALAISDWTALMSAFLPSYCTAFQATHKPALIATHKATHWTALKYAN